MRTTLAAAFFSCALTLTALAAPPPPTTSPTPLEGLRDWIAKPRPNRPDLKTQPFATVPLSKIQAEQAAQSLRDDHAACIRESRQQEWKDQAITLADHTLKWKQRQFGVKPKDGWNLFLSMHGGGGAPAELNDQQWENQIKLYQPKDSLYIAPRAPTNTWNLWHEPHMDGLLNRLIEDAITLGDVNPNRVYIMGYSAGGDGVYQLAPRMADRLAAASMMAGHPNDASPLGLRNIGFAIHVGAMDDGYSRNKVAAEWGTKLDALREADPGGYAHRVELHAGRGHWMNLEDKSAVEWMARFTRNPLPEKVVWKQSSTLHDSFYWLAMAKGDAKPGQLVIASRDKQEIAIEKSEGVDAITIRLSDGMLDMDQPITITAGGKSVFKGIVPRSIRQLQKSLEEHGDAFSMYEGSVTVKR